MYVTIDRQILANLRIILYKEFISVTSVTLGQLWFACARTQHVILGMLAAMNTRKARYIGYFGL